jgi:hypothetical protein
MGGLTGLAFRKISKWRAVQARRKGCSFDGLAVECALNMFPACAMAVFKISQQPRQMLFNQRVHGSSTLGHMCDVCSATFPAPRQTFGQAGDEEHQLRNVGTVTPQPATCSVALK